MECFCSWVAPSLGTSLHCLTLLRLSGRSRRLGIRRLRTCFPQEQRPAAACASRRAAMDRLEVSSYTSARGVSAAKVLYGSRHRHGLPLPQGLVPRAAERPPYFEARLMRAAGIPSPAIARHGSLPATEREDSTEELRGQIQNGALFCKLPASSTYVGNSIVPGGGETKMDIFPSTGLAARRGWLFSEHIYW